MRFNSGKHYLFERTTKLCSAYLAVFIFFFLIDFVDRNVNDHSLFLTAVLYQQCSARSYLSNCLIINVINQLSFFITQSRSAIYSFMYNNAQTVLDEYSSLLAPYFLSRRHVDSLMSNQNGEKIISFSLQRQVMITGFPTQTSSRQIMNYVEMMRCCILNWGISF